MRHKDLTIIIALKKIEFTVFGGWGSCSETYRPLCLPSIISPDHRTSWVGDGALGHLGVGTNRRLLASI